MLIEEFVVIVFKKEKKVFILMNSFLKKLKLFF